MRKPIQRTLGIIGGMSWVSTLDYYRLINEQVQRRLGRQHSANLLIASLDFQLVVDAQARGDWAGAALYLAQAARGLERGGATSFLIASNTMHRVLADVAASVAIPALNIFDATADALRKAGLSRLGLLGTRYTMNDPFFRDEYAKRGISVVIPSPSQARLVNQIIFEELIHAIVKPSSIVAYQEVASELLKAGAEGIILGCTEIKLLFPDCESRPNLFDTSRLHAMMAVDWLLQGPEKSA